MKWNNFEKECQAFLTSTYGDHFVLEGNTNSTICDILYTTPNNQFFIEVKMNEAQSGQFVLLPNLEQQVFEYSPKNKTDENIYTKKIMNYISSHFNDFLNAGTSGVNINLNEDIFYQWIIDFYKNKGVKFIITKDNDNFIIFPIENLPLFFSVSATYREKKSGSSKFTNNNIDDLFFALKDYNIKFHINENLNIFSFDEDLDNKKFAGKNYTYLIKKISKNQYDIRRLSNTKNSNVIFKLRIKQDISPNLIQQNKIIFEKSL